MNAAEALASHRAMVAEIGEAVTVRRYSGPGASRSHVDTPTQARVTGYLPQEIVGDVTQGDRKVIALADTLAAVLPLTTSDRLVIRGREVAIKAVDDNTRRIGGVLVALVIQAAG
jgi:hypothetical protein